MQQTAIHQLSYEIFVHFSTAQSAPASAHATPSASALALSTPAASSVPFLFQNPISFSLLIAPPPAPVPCLRACVPVTVPAAVLPLPLSLLLAPFLGVVTSYKLEKVEILLPKRGRVTRPPSPSEPPPPKPHPKAMDPAHPTLSHPSTACFSICLFHSTLSHPRPLPTFPPNHLLHSVALSLRLR